MKKRRRAGTYVTKCGCRKRYPIRNRFKIKNWYKTKGREDSWENTKTHTRISIEKLSEKYYVEEAWITDLFQVHKRRKITGDLSDRETAKLFAYQYMKEHKDFR